MSFAEWAGWDQQRHAGVCYVLMLDVGRMLGRVVYGKECYCWSAAGSSAGVVGPGLPVDCRAKWESGSNTSVGPFNCTLEQVRDVGVRMSGWG